MQQETSEQQVKTVCTVLQCRKIVSITSAAAALIEHSTLV